MGQNRTALILGTKAGAKLSRFLRSDWAHEKFHDEPDASGMQWHIDSKPNTVGFAIAVAYDPPQGCAALRLPLAIDRIDKDATLKAAYHRAMRRWVRLSNLLQKYGQDPLGVPEIFLGEVETA